MTNLYRTSGLDNAPLFINYTPFRLDFSRRRQNDDEKFALMKELTQRNLALRDKAKDAKLPEWEGRPNDVAHVTQMALAAKKKINEGFRKYSNANYAMDSEEVKQGTRMLQEVSSPATMAILKDRQASLDRINSTVTKKRDEGDAITNIPFTINGMPVPDPSNPTDFLRVGDAIERGAHHPGYTFADGEMAYPLDKAFTGTIRDLDKSMAERIKTDAESVFQKPYNEIIDPRNASKTAQELAASGKGSAMLNYAFLANGYTKSANNYEQIAAGLSNVRSSLTDQEQLQLLQGFMQTDEYQKGVNPKNGEFIKDGVIDYAAINRRMMQGKDYDIPVPGSKKSYKGSYADKYINNIAGRFMKNAWQQDVNYSKLHDYNEAKAEGAGLVPDLYAFKQGFAEKFVVDNNGELKVGSIDEGQKVEKRPFVVAGSEKGGTAPYQMGASVDAILFHPGGKRVANIRAENGLPQNAVDKPEEYQYLKAEQAPITATSPLITTLRGVPVKKEGDVDPLKNWQVIEISPAMEARPGIDVANTGNLQALAEGQVKGMHKAPVDFEGNQKIPAMNPASIVGPTGTPVPDLWQKVTMRIPKSQYVPGSIKDAIPADLAENGIQGAPGTKRPVPGKMTFGLGPFGGAIHMVQESDPVAFLTEKKKLDMVDIADDRFLENGASGVREEGDYIVSDFYVKLGESILNDQSIKIDPQLRSVGATTMGTAPLDAPPRTSGEQQQVNYVLRNIREKP